MKRQITTLLLATTIALSFNAAITPGQAQAASTGSIVSSVNFRSQPNVNSTSYGYLKAGEKVSILNKVNDYWYQVRDSSGRVGYVSTSSKYITTSGSVSAPSNSSGGTSSSAGDSTALRNKIISAGKKYLGTPYEYGSDRSNTKTFDCSDFVRQAFKDGAGITLPGDSRGQASYVKSIGKTTTNWRDLKPGDLMFFMEYRGVGGTYPSNKSNQTVTHVAMYIGNGQILSTYSKQSGGVRIDSIAGTHWEKRFIFGGSALK
ncbi:C40 family peptidase [Paenibacillus cremeus]|uniref:NlpC/P60 family protein n=1 Tax=Paenibacillus cremeus TaxID=2163881 RepID=A0A559KDK8_9BACL|nr:SH3 domain-containing C40 family peptidase [Paenibacillus cremeus]TVY10222.1 NlpC/P60 family protein [Paenibacillus cremeus]